MSFYIFSTCCTVEYIFFYVHLFNVAYKAKNSSPELTQHAVAGLGDFTVPEDDKNKK